MGRTVILSEETLRSLLEANASMSAWYHEFVRASREQTPVAAPSDETRKAFLDRIALDLPEVASVVRELKTCRMFVPPPLSYNPRATIPDTSYHAGATPPAPQEPGVDRPPLVNPRQVKY
jgi:hypothetical protein